MRFAISFTISAAKLTTILGALENEVQDLKLEQVGRSNGTQEPTAKRQPPVRIMPRPSPVRDTVMKVFADGQPHSVADVTRAIMDAKLNGNSVSPCMSKLVKTGELVSLGKGNFKKS